MKATGEVQAGPPARGSGCLRCLRTPLVRNVRVAGTANLCHLGAFESNEIGQSLLIFRRHELSKRLLDLDKFSLALEESNEFD